MRLVFEINSNYNETDRNLRILGREGLIVQRYHDGKRSVSLNFQSEKTKHTLEIIKVLNDFDNL